MNDRKMTITEASRGFADLINRTRYRGESTVLLRAGVPVARVVPVAETSQTGGEFAARWREMEHLDEEDAMDFGNVVEEARQAMGVPESPWA